MFIGEVLKKARNTVAEPKYINRDKLKSLHNLEAKKEVQQKMLTYRGQLSNKHQQIKKSLEFGVRLKRQGSGLKDYELSSI
jgi:hypothetical protein